MDKSKSEKFAPAMFPDIFTNAEFFRRNWLEKESAQSLPAVNITETAKEFNLEFAVPGYKKEDFRISVENNVLSISAEKQQEKKEETKQYTRREFSCNAFSRSFSLPENAQPEDISANYNSGVLKLRVPKISETRMLPKKEITVA